MNTALLLVALVSGVPGAEPPARAPEAAAVAAPTLPAAGRQSTLLAVPRFGRYAVLAKSASGTSLRLVDRMVGPGDVAGLAGERDGRVDAFLDRGTYKLVTGGPDRARGTVTLAVHAFTETSGPKPPLLVELKPVEDTLRDLEQRSYWLWVGERRTVALEAAGRSLADLRLWREGTWLVDAAPATQVVQPRVGEPLLVCRLQAALEPGLYLLTAYGGPAQPWAAGGDRHPMYLRFGIPRLPEAGRRRLAVSPFGLDRFRAPRATNTFRIELPEARPATLRLGDFDPASPFTEGTAAAAIEKKSVPPAAEIVLSGEGEGEGEEEAEREAAATGKGDRVVTVSGEAGQPYVLQHFHASEHYAFSRGGDHWVSSVHTGHPEDSVDATGILVRNQSGRVSPLQTAVVEMETTRRYERRFNLLAPLTLYFHLAAGGTYEVLTEGTPAQHRVEPFLIYRPERYEAPPWRGSGWAWELEPGYHVLTVTPERRGIVTLTVRPRGLLAAAAGMAGLAAAAPPAASVRFPKVALDPRESYTLCLNEQPEVRAGLVLRSLPLDLREALPLTLAPGDSVSVPFAIDEEATLRAEAEDGSALDVSLDGGPFQARAEVRPGPHTAAVRGGGTGVRHASLLAEPRRLQASAPLPALPDDTLAALPRFPVLDASAPRHLDLDRRESATFLVQAAEPGLYVLESTGLLATEGNLRSRTVTSFTREAENGVGRNFRLGQYLREGDYQLTVTTQGETRGHLGVALARTAVVDGGFLTSRVPGRASLRAGSALAYRFVVTRPGRFRVRALGLGRGFRCRLEDQDGWPLVAPGGEADVTHDFGPGRYRFVVLPEATDARVVALVEPVAPPVRAVGHGPHRLPLDRSVGHVWREPEAGAPRTPDAWELTLPASVEVAVELTGEMQGEIRRLAEGAAAATPVPVGGWKGTLAPGRYRLEVVSSRPNNGAPYTVGVWPKPLVAGLERAVSAPGELELAVGQDGLVEIGSFGETDVKARLYDEGGRLVASGDDRPDDWNFALQETLAAGRYRLVVAPVGTATAATRVFVRTPRETDQPPLAVPAAAEVALGRDVLLYPLAAPPAADLVALTASSAEAVGLAVESQAGGAWRTLGSDRGRAARVALALGPRQGRPPLRVRVWSLDRRGAKARLAASALLPLAVAEKDLARGFSLPKDGAAELRLDRPGLLRVEGDAAGLRWCAAGEACRESPAGVVAAHGDRVWVVADGARSVRTARLTLGEDGTGAVVVAIAASRPATVDLAAGPAILVASAAVVPPGVAAVESGRGATGRALAVGGRASVTATLGARAALVWADPAAEVRVERRPFAAPRAEPVPRSPWDGAVAGSGARAFDLGRGDKRLDLALGPHLVGVLSKGEDVLSVHWVDGEAVAETVDTTADRLTLVNLGEGEGRFSASRLALDRVRPALAAGAPFEEARASAGTLRLEVAPAPGATLHVRGARGEAVLVSADGRIARGRDLAAPAAGGTLVVPHGPGRVLAWLDAKGAEAAGLWPEGASSRAKEVEPPASVELSGQARLLRVDLRQPALVHVRATTPGVSLVRRPSLPPEVRVHEAGASFDAWLPAGRTEIGLRAFAGAELAGTAEVTVTEVTPVGEGLGPEGLLAPGATRLFSFAVARPGPVGLGVRASADVVGMRLLSSRGEDLGEGTVLMPTLDPGTYLLALHAPPDAAGPVAARPAVSGLTPPDTGPPEDVVRAYLAPEEPAGVFTARRVEAPPPVEEGRLAEEEGPPGEEGEGPPEGEGEEPPDEEAAEPPTGGGL
jgi:hypothetical protein